MIPNAVKDKNINPYFAYMLVVVDTRTEQIVFNQMMRPVPTLMDMHSKIPQYFVDMINDLGSRPQKIYVRSDMLSGLLKPLAKNLGLKFKLVERLHIMESVKEGFGEFMNPDY